jgi:hypothetical protein
LAPESVVFGFEVAAVAAVAAALDAVFGTSGSAVFTGAGASAGITGLTMGAAVLAVGASAGFSGLAALSGASGCFEEPLPTRITVSVPTTTVNATAAVMRIGVFGLFGLSGGAYPADVWEKPAPVAGPDG